MTDFNAYYSYKYNLIKINYKIEAFDSNYEQILPSDLTLGFNLHIICYLNINNTFNIHSLPKIEEDKYFKCIEFYRMNENITIGIIVYESDTNGLIKHNYSIYNINNFQFNDYYQNDNEFRSFTINKEYNLLYKMIQNNTTSFKSKNLKKLYISTPVFTLKRNSFNISNYWYFINIYNEYFCFCEGLNCLSIMVTKKCKYFYYLYLIDINRNVYKKTDFLLMDFIFKNYSSDDVLPIYEKMINRNLSAHYITEDQDMYKKHCQKIKFCESIINVNEKNYKINDIFLEKHFTMILKLRYVLNSVGININYINNLFYNIDYITYICIGHGVAHFKSYLYEDYYGPNNFHKLLIPKTDKLINMAIKHGWKDEDLIKFNLPRWEKYNYRNKSSNFEIYSIFVMFTWRRTNINMTMSEYYFENIINLLKNEKLINNLLKYNITLYFSLHHGVIKYKSKFTDIYNMKYIKLIEENQIAEILSKTNLVVTDFSSIIFDMIYRRKPYIIYIPDINDPHISTKYEDNNYIIIKKFQSNEFEFENIYLDINSTINRINYYINNKFKLDNNLKVFYRQFNFKKGSIINEFIDFLLDKNSMIISDN